MFLNLLKHYLRSITRRKLFSFINITGLAFSIAFLILIGQFIYYEFNHNSSLNNIDNIYRVVDADQKSYGIDYRMKEQVVQGIPGIQKACLLSHFNFPVDVEGNNNLNKVNNIAEVDSNFFDVFDIIFVSGNPKLALSSLENVVITETTANKIFGSINVIGKPIRIDHQYEMIIAGVVKDLPKSLSFDVDIIVSYLRVPAQKFFCKMSSLDNKVKYPFSVFVELNKNANKTAVEKQISSLNSIDNYLYPKNAILSPLGSNYFNTDYNEADLLHGNSSLVKLLSIIGIVVLLLAIINYINLTTASYRCRLTEFGVKKCMGADRKSIVKQLITESLFTTIISALLGIILAGIFLPYFNQFIDKKIPMQIFTDLKFILIFLGFILLVGFIIGAFPSIILSRISVMQLFKINPSLKGSGKVYRNILTMFQFSVAIILITGLIIVYGQIDYVKHKDIGFSTEKLLYLNIHYALKDRIQVLTDKLKQYPGIKSVTKTNGVPGKINMNFSNYQTMAIDSNTLKTFGFKLIKGRNILPGDINKAGFINETALKQLVGQKWENMKINIFEFNGKDFRPNGYEIIGVVSDFNYLSLHSKIEPAFLCYNNRIVPGNITIRISGSISDAMSNINKVWKEVSPDYPIDLNFYDDQFAAMYKKEENLASMVSLFSLLAVVISCLGIFGLSVFQSEQRIKEIGIRKVLGATVLEIFGLLTKNFSSWVILANIIAVPVSYYLMSKWLEDFAYKIGLSWWIFALAGGIALLIALITISINTIKAATSNPVESLRCE